MSMTASPIRPPSVDELIEQVRDARRATLELVADLDDEQLLGPQLGIVNPLLWEIGHVGWFQEKFALRELYGQAPIREDGDALWDSIAIPHDDRWDLALPPREETVAYLKEVRDGVVERLERTRRRGGPTAAERELVTLALAHEDMHTEAFTYTRQTHGWPAPPRTIGDGASGASAGGADAGPHPGDVEIPGGVYLLGSPRDYPFTLDNEHWEHPVELAPFRIARAPVTQAELAAFVDDGGYERRELWSDEGWRWRTEAGAEHPVYWRRAGDGWERRVFDRWIPLEPHRPAIHVSWYEAEAWCRWAGRRLPTEAEWEAAAAGPAPKRYLPWGGEPADATRANVDWAGLEAGGTVDVGASPEGDGPFGCRQMIGNVWEWTETGFGPYPGFSPGPYREYSEPWFGGRKVLRGGCWATRGRLLRSTWRNYYPPERRDVWAGFRTCALD